LFCYFVGVFCIFFLAANLYFESQTNKQKTCIYPRIKNCVRRAAKVGPLEQKTSRSIAMEFLSLRPANCSSNRNVALHARSLGPPCYIPMVLNRGGAPTHGAWINIQGGASPHAHWNMESLINKFTDKCICLHSLLKWEVLEKMTIT